MSGQLPPQHYPAQDGYAQPQEHYASVSPLGTAPGATPPAAPGQGGRKKRAYAGQAYEFGAGPNSALGGQQQGGAGYSGFSQQQHEAGYPQGGYQQTPAAGQQGQVPLYGHQEGGAAGGYQPPAPAYPVAGAAPAVGGGVGGITQQFGQMDMSQKPAPQAAPQRAPVLNQLYPADLLNQPFNVQELDYPPPLAILPPNVSVKVTLFPDISADFYRPVLLPLPTRIVLPNMSDRP
jgi:protein transport protein SEC24